MSTREIFKVQRDETGKRILIYNRDRSITQELEDPDGSIASKFSLAPLTKQYWRASIGEDGLFHAHKQVKERAW